MKLASGNEADTLEIAILGYQFPDADDPRQRYSWHMITGQATSTDETWTFQYPALTCDESPRLTAWLRQVAQWLDNPGKAMARPGKLTFTEPNLALDLVGQPLDRVVIDVELDLEFRSPRNRTRREAGTPNLLHLTLTREALLSAASDWEQDVEHYPDLSP